MSPARLSAALAVAVFALAGCGAKKLATSAGKPDLIVSAAASLKAPLIEYGSRFTEANVRLSFAGSDQLAAQIREGGKPDVFAAADKKLPEALFRAGLTERPSSFARNRLVVAVPAGGRKLRSLADIEQPGVTIAIGSPSVPIGAYARSALARLPRARSARILGNVRSDEPDVAGIVGKLTEGAVDAGFLYATDVRASKGALRAIALPASLQPTVAYAAAVVRGAAHPAQARRFVAGLLAGAGARALHDAGFLPPPAP